MFIEILEDGHIPHSFAEDRETAVYAAMNHIALLTPDGLEIHGSYGSVFLEAYDDSADDKAYPLVSFDFRLRFLKRASDFVELR